MSECSCPAPQPWGWNHVPLPSPEVISAVPDPCSLLNKKNLVPSLCSVSSVPPRPLPELAKTQGRGDGTTTSSAQGSSPLQAHTHTQISSSLLSQARFIYTALLPTADFLWKIHGFPSTLSPGRLPFPPGTAAPQPGVQLSGALTAPSFLQPPVASPGGRRAVC